MDIFDNNINESKKIKGISEVRLEKIIVSYEKSKSMGDIIGFLAPFGITIDKISKIHKLFGANTMEVVTKRPFELCSISGFGFKTVDRIAQKTHCKPNDVSRIEGAGHFLIDDGMKAGHLYLEKDEFINGLEKLLNEGFSGQVVRKLEIRTALYKMVKENRLIFKDDKFYSLNNYKSEESVAKSIAEMLVKKPIVRNIESKLEKAQSYLKITLSKKQALAVKMCMENNISIITGGPGTGKTTVLKVILEVYKNIFGGEVLLSAPTGRASRRMSESTGYDSKTLHKALGIMSNDDSAGELPVLIEADFIIIDETSMMDQWLTNEFLKRTNKNMKILFVGDADQLPSVGAGNVFRELTNCSLIPLTRLDVVFRQSCRSRMP